MRIELARPPWRAPPAPRRLLPLLRELGDLKRIVSADREGSIATRLFLEAWARLVAGEPPESVADAITASALVAARLGDLDAAKLAELGLSEAEASAVLRAALAELAPMLDADLRERLERGLASAEREPLTFVVLRSAEGASRSTHQGSVSEDAPDRGACFEASPAAARTGSAPPHDEGEGAIPPFARLLAAQPRAGVTCPGRPRIVLLPAENHAEHCLAVAVYGMLLAPGYGADPVPVFLAGLAHHLHNAAMPDSGFTGETLLGAHLGPAMERATEAALAELPAALRAAVVAARAILPDASTPEGRAFHAADVLDRVLEIDQHLARARLTMADVLGEMELVHEGPVKPFHDAVLAEMGLLP